MKQCYFLILLFFAIGSYAQDYHKQWEKVVALEQDGKIKDANALVSKIYRKAERHENEPQLVKCFFYESKYAFVLEADAQQRILEKIKFEQEKVSEPTKAIFSLIYAQCLLDYWKKQQFHIQARPEDSVGNKHISLWTRNKFDREINSALDNSLAYETTLKQTSLKKYEQVFDFLSKEQFLGETVYEYALKENIRLRREFDAYSSTYSKTDELMPALSDESQIFVTTDLSNVRDRRLAKILGLMQQLERFRPSAGNWFDRIKFLHHYASLGADDYLRALGDVREEASDLLLIQNIGIERAAIFIKVSDRMRGVNRLEDALKTIDTIIAAGERSNADAIAREFKQRILARSINVRLKDLVYPYELTRASVSFRNVDSLRVSYYRIPADMQLRKNYNLSIPDSVAAKLKMGKPQYSQSYAFNAQKDYFEHSVEVILPKIDIGTYLVHFETNGPADGTNAFAYQIVTATNIALLGSRNNGITTFTALHRKTGKPIAGVVVKNSGFERQTNQDGQALMETHDQHQDDIRVIFQSDTLDIKSLYLRQDNDDKPQALAQLYLDRAIYRPGQTVYYKGIVMRKQLEKKDVVTGLRVLMKVSDPDKEIFETIVTTNEFGSFSGEFKLPESVLNGEYEIELEEPDDIDEEAIYDDIQDKHPFWDVVEFHDEPTRFRVEEYKRPKFEVSFNPIREAYVLGDTATISGNAKAYAGSNVTAARVVYRIVRQPHYSQQRQQYIDYAEILSDTIQTDENGRFEIKFTPETDIGDDKAITEWRPHQNYDISAKVTDVNGETIEAETDFAIGRHALQTSVSIVDPEIKKANTILVNSSNLNGEFLAARGKLDFYRTKRNGEGFKPRQFGTPEIDNLTCEEFKALFPYEAEAPEALEISDTIPIKTILVDTEKNTRISADFSAFPAGEYKVVFTATDASGVTIDSGKTFTLTDTRAKFDTSRLITLKLLNTDPKKDGFALVRVTSPVPDLSVRISAAYGHKTYFEQSVALSNHENTLRIPFHGDFWHGITVGAYALYDNHFDTAQLPVDIKMATPGLLFETISFRSKIEPGTPETWSFRITGHDKKAEAEFLATMYDASLDTFEKPYWAPPGFSQKFYHYMTQPSYREPSNVAASLQNLQHYLPMRTRRLEDTQLIRFGFTFNNEKPVFSNKLYKEQLTRKARKPLGTRVVSGIVSDEAGPLPSANVVIKGGHRGVQTDVDGYYEIEAAIGEILEFSFIGMQDRSIAVEDYAHLDVTLFPGGALLGEVVVSGAMGIRKTLPAQTASMMVIKADDLMQTAYPNAVLALVGKVSGLQVNTTNSGVSRNSRIVLRGNRSLSENSEILIVIDGKIATFSEFEAIAPVDISNLEVIKGSQGAALYGEMGAGGVIVVTTKKAVLALGQLTARTNLSETAFFLPHLTSDEKGDVIVKFKSPEALTAWKFRLVGHNKSGESGFLQETVTTQKNLMLSPNFPRFLRENDSIVITAKVANLTAKPMTGNVLLQLLDASNMQSVDISAGNSKSVRTFAVAAYGNSSVSWKIFVPEGLAGMQYRIVAQSGDFSDGEESVLPVLTNRALITESIPLWVRPNKSADYVLANLKNNTSRKLRHHQLTLEYTSNPTWIALQSLPYLLEYEHECAEQLFARFYANALALDILDSNPKISAVLDEWRANAGAKTEHNQELKSLLLAETPWFADAKSEAEKKHKLALLLNSDALKQAQRGTLRKLSEKQKDSGGFGWFDGSPENEFITRHILAGLGHLKKLGIETENRSEVSAIARKAIAFADNSFLQRPKTGTRDKLLPDFTASESLHYLYVRSFFLKEFPPSTVLDARIRLQLQHVKADWLDYGLYEKALSALVMHRFGETALALKIVESLDQTSATNDTYGMHWIENRPGHSWNQSPVETQALLIEAFAEIRPDSQSIEAMKVWLLKNKQQKSWASTKSTTEAVYALLMHGDDWLEAKHNTVLKVGDKKVETQKSTGSELEAASGYVKMTWPASEITKDMAALSITNRGDVPGYGGFFWQYFEEFDKTENVSGDLLSVQQQLFSKKTANGGLVKINPADLLKVGETVTVRIEVSVAQDLEFVHLKSMRASCFEPVDVLSGYHRNAGIGYYKSTKDAATHFFIDRLPKGEYVFEYDMRVNNPGDFSNGITTIQSMYAPEFSAHSKGIRVKTQD